jgi:hypothetical protein
MTSRYLTGRLICDRCGFTKDVSVDEDGSSSVTWAAVHFARSTPDGETLSQYERRRRFGPTMKSRNSFGDRRHG